MNIRIFYSWQSDLPNKFNRSFIEDCISKAIKKIQNSDKFELSLNLERDTRNEPGTPDIVEAIFNKIKSSHIFIADISIVTSNGKRQSPNPNVLLELGFAAGIIGWENIICVYNSSIAPVESLPFDLRSRRPIIYKYDEDDNTESVKFELTNKIESAIKAIDYNLTEAIQELKLIFNNESDKAKYLIQTKPKYWELQLLEELIRSKMVSIRKGYADLEKGLIFNRKKRLSDEEFLDWFTVSLETYSQFYAITSKVFNEELRENYGKGNPKQMKQTIDLLIESCKSLLDWELELNSMILSAEMEEIKEVLRGATVEGFGEINSLPDKIKLVLKSIDTSNEHTITLKHNSPQHLARASELFKAYMNNRR